MGVNTAEGKSTGDMNEADGRAGERLRKTVETWLNLRLDRNIKHDKINRHDTNSMQKRPQINRLAVRQLC